MCSPFYTPPSNLLLSGYFCFFFFSSRRRHTRFKCDWSSDVCSSDLSGGLWDVRIQLSTGEVISQTALLGMTAPALMLATGELIYGDANGIVVRKPDGAEKHIHAQLPLTFAFQQMGEGWIQVRDLATQRQYALRLTEGKEQFYALPGVDQ